MEEEALPTTLDDRVPARSDSVSSFRDKREREKKREGATLRPSSHPLISRGI